jgi:hypothetical protein
MHSAANKRCRCRDRRGVHRLEGTGPVGDPLAHVMRLASFRANRLAVGGVDGVSVVTRSGPILMQYATANCRFSLARGDYGVNE